MKMTKDILKQNSGKSIIEILRSKPKKIKPLISKKEKDTERAIKEYEKR